MCYWGAYEGSKSLGILCYPFAYMNLLLLTWGGAQRSTRWLFPEAPPDLINFNMAQKHRIFDPPKIGPYPMSLALGPLGDTTQGLETKLEPNWSRKGAISPPVL